MTDYFLDSSGLIKRYIPEQGMFWVRSITAPGAGHSIIIATLTYVEIISGLRRRVREGHLSAQHAHLIRNILDRHLGNEYTSVGLSQPLVSHAGDLLETHSLRAFDAIQLASALEAKDRRQGGVSTAFVFVSADKRLLTAAIAEGLAVDDPNAHP